MQTLIYHWALEGKYKTSAFGDEPRRMLKVNQRLGKRCSCHFQDQYSQCLPKSWTTFNIRLAHPR
jgi:hypothetical protein